VLNNIAIIPAEDKKILATTLLTENSTENYCNIGEILRLYAAKSIAVFRAIACGKAYSGLCSQGDLLYGPFVFGNFREGDFASWQDFSSRFRTGLKRRSAP